MTGPRSTDTLHAEVVVVGAGVTGAASAAALTRRGVRPLVLEGRSQASGSTGSSGGMVRAYDPDPVVTRLAAASLVSYADPAGWPGGRSPLRPAGAVTLAPRELTAELGMAAEALRSAGHAEAHVVDGSGPQEVLGIHRDDAAALVEPAAGWVDPVEVTTLYLSEALAGGARILTGARVMSVRPSTAGTLLKTTAVDVLATGAVVLAIGAWAAWPPAGAGAPRTSTRTRAIQVSVVRRPPGAPPHATFVDLRTGCYGKPVDERHTLVGLPLLRWGEHPDDGPGPDLRHHERTLRTAAPRLGWRDDVSTVRIVRSFDRFQHGAGLALLQETAAPEVWLARAGSGTGVKVAPEVGRLIADQVVSRIR
ncbi:FAD-dependent oxidoreductase [Streptomyces sp. NPDC050610]|uniref:FAD-dependent oxidoreductase n=1 Tax=Streptomyces sp. NPDC050610 TaxID=3157097 RepID=UPI00341AB3A0